MPTHLLIAYTVFTVVPLLYAISLVLRRRRLERAIAEMEHQQPAD